MTHPILSRVDTAILVVDIQEKLFNQIERPCELLESLVKFFKAVKILNLPSFVTEQYPQGLGSTIGAIKSVLGPQQEYLTKTSFSCLGDSKIKERLLQQERQSWILVGIEAHVCVLQTAKQLKQMNRDVVVLNDGISSRSIYDYSTAIAEMRDGGIRISSTETVLFELLGDSLAPEFKQILELLK